MSVKIANLDFKSGKPNPSGILPIAYAVKKSQITSWPTIIDDPDAEGADLAQMVNYEGDFVLAQGVNFLSIYSTHGKGKATFEPQGEADCKSYINKATLSFPVIDDNARGYAKMVVNDDYVYVIPAPGNKFHVIGSPDYPALTTVNGDTGDAPTSAHGLTINVECTDTTPLPCYKGQLKLADKTIDCSTGEETPNAG